MEMKASRVNSRKQSSAPKPVTVKKRVVRKSAKAAAKNAAYAAYVRDHEKAYHTLTVIENNTHNAVQSIVAKVLAKRKA